MAMIGRRGVLMGAGALLALGGCTTGLGSASGLEARVETTRNYLLATYPDAAALVQSAAGVLYMPLMTEAAFGPGAAYGEGALKVNDQTADYYSAVQGTFGVQAGAQQYSHVLIFRTPEALASFRAMPGWVAAAEFSRVSSRVQPVPQRGEAVNLARRHGCACRATRTPRQGWPIETRVYFVPSIAAPAIRPDCPKIIATTGICIARLSAPKFCPPAGSA